MTTQPGMDEEMQTAMAEEAAPAEDTEQPEAVKKKVARWLKKIKEARSFWGDAFDQMRDDMDFALGLQWPDQKDVDDSANGYRYVANLVQRHLRQREAALYAKNPKAVAHKRKTRPYAIWDEDSNSLMEAQQLLMEMQMAAQQNPAMLQQMMQLPQVQQAQALVQDVQQGRQRRQQLNALADTLEIVYEYEIHQQRPRFKRSMKRVVRRALTTGVGYVKLGYTREMGVKPEDVDRVNDTAFQINRIQDLMETVTDPEHRSELEDNMNELQDSMRILQEPAILREGLDYDYPRSTSIIPDKCCTDIEDFLGAQWVAQEFKLTPEQIKEIYGTDVKDKYRAYDFEGNQVKNDAHREMDSDDKKDNTLALVYEVYDKTSGMTFTVCEGFDGYLREPDTPDITLERFWPFFSLTFNGLEHEETVFPPSDVSLMRSMQVEYNLSRQRLREHRDAARPGHATPKGRMEQSDKDKLSGRNAHDIIEIAGMGDNDDIRRLLQPIPTNPIDPNLYDTNMLEGDIYKTLGSQEAVMGGASKATATETSIAESSRLSSIGSNVDDLDDLLTDMAREASRVLMTEMSEEKVREIAGPGAVWATLSADEAAKNLWLEIRAGSAGRPNKSAEIQNLERILPFLLQIPGAKPQRVLEEIITRLDDRLNVEDFVETGAPSIMAMNRQAQMGDGSAGSDPNEQGAEGGDQNTVEQGDSNMGPRAPAENRNMDPNRPN